MLPSSDDLSVDTLKSSPADPSRAQPQDVPLTVRFVPVAADPVIDVRPVDDAHVLAVVRRRRRGLRLWSEGADTRLIAVPPALFEAT